jgi:hypothetical protein
MGSSEIHSEQSKDLNDFFGLASNPVLGSSGFPRPAHAFIFPLDFFLGSARIP